MISPRLSPSNSSISHARPSCETRYRVVSSVTINIKFSHRGLHRISEDERTVKTAHLKPVCSNGPYTAEGFRRTGTRRISSWPGDTSPYNRPDTLTQTFFIHQLFPCIQTADPLRSELAENRTLPYNIQIWLAAEISVSMPPGVNSSDHHYKYQRQ